MQPCCRAGHSWQARLQQQEPAAPAPAAAGAGTDLSLNWAVGPDAPVMGNLTVHRAAGSIRIQPEGAVTPTRDGAGQASGGDGSWSSGAKAGAGAGGVSTSTTSATSSSSEGDCRRLPPPALMRPYPCMQQQQQGHGLRCRHSPEQRKAAWRRATLSRPGQC
jgi:hypothetical protein